MERPPLDYSRFDPRGEEKDDDEAFIQQRLGQLPSQTVGAPIRRAPQEIRQLLVGEDLDYDRDPDDEVEDDEEPVEDLDEDIDDEADNEDDPEDPSLELDEEPEEDPDDEEVDDTEDEEDVEEAETEEDEEEEPPVEADPLPLTAPRAPVTETYRTTPVEDEPIAPSPIDPIKPPSFPIPERLEALNLNEEERKALLESVEGREEAIAALLRLVGLAKVGRELQTKDPEAASDLQQEIDAGRETEVAKNAIRFLHNTEKGHHLLEKLQRDATKLTVIEAPLELAHDPHGTHGRPKLLGRVIGISLWWFQPIPRKARTKREGRWAEYAGTAVEFVNDVLGHSGTIRGEKRTDLQAGDHVAFQLDVEARGSVEKVYVLTRLHTKDGKLTANLPSSAEDTMFRFIQGMLDGFTVIDQQGHVQHIYDRLTYAPLVLSRNRVPSPRTSRGCPANTEELREQLGAHLDIQCQPHFTGGPMWYLEPSWMTVGSGMRVVEPMSEDVAVDTPAFRDWIAEQRQRANDTIRESAQPRHKMLRLLLEGGAANLEKP